MSVDPSALDFEAIAAQAPVAWSVIDLEGRQIVGNPVYAELFGYGVHEIARLTVADLTHPEDRDRTDDYLRQLITGEIERYETDKRYVRKDGSVFVGHLIASLLRDEEGTPRAMVGVIQDVTEARALADTVARNEERLSKMLTNISDTVSLVDASGQIHASTGLHTEILGHPTSFWRERSIFDLVHPDETERARAMADEVLGTPGAEVIQEFRVRHHDGHYEEVELAAVNLLEDPAVEAVVLTTRNISARKADERAMVRMRDRALALAEQRAGFVANVSHELRTPLHAVLGLAELLAESDLDDEQARLVAGIHAEATHLRTTVDDLLDYARVEAEGITLEPAPVDLRELVASVVQRASVTEHATGLDVGWHVDERVPAAVMADGHRVEQILTNLVANATKFTPKGHVDVDVRPGPTGTVELCVSDTGPGIAPEHREAVFQPFEQVPGVVSAVGGTGLGLALVHGLVDLMDGTVTLADRDGGGCVFTVRLALAPAGDGPDASGSDAPDAAAAGADVLVVEDNPTNQLLVRQQLERLGHTCTIAPDGAAALELLGPADHGFDIVLMDWQLPDLDGLEVTRRLRTIEEGRGGHVPVVAATASAMPEDRAACRAAGMDDFLPKPIGLDDLKTMIDRWATVTDAPAPATVRADAGEVDRSKIDGLVDDLGDASIVVSLVDSYLTELTNREAALGEALTTGDIEVLHRIGHTLRSTSEMLGATGLVVACRKLEAADDQTDLGPLLAEFRAAAEATRADLVAWQDEQEQAP